MLQQWLFIFPSFKVRLPMPYLRRQQVVCDTYHNGLGRTLDDCDYDIANTIKITIPWLKTDTLKLDLWKQNALLWEGVNVFIGVFSKQEELPLMGLWHHVTLEPILKPHSTATSINTLHWMLLEQSFLVYITNYRSISLCSKDVNIRTVLSRLMTVYRYTTFYSISAFNTVFEYEGP